MDSNLFEIWQQHSAQIEQNSKLNIKLLREVNLDKTKSSVKSTLFLPVSTLLFYSIILILSLQFCFEHLNQFHLLGSGITVSIFSGLFIQSSILQLKNIHSINYDAPLLELQTDLSNLKLSLLRNLRIALWTLPFYPAIIIVLSQSLWQVDIVSHLPNHFILTHLGIMSILLISVFHFSNNILPHHLNHKWVNFLLLGNGSQVDEALKFVEEIKEFEMES